MLDRRTGRRVTSRARFPRGAPLYDPAVLDLTFWARASYSGSPWGGEASAGVSGSHQVSEATDPPQVGTAVNGRTPAEYFTGDQLVSAVGMSTFIATNAWSAWVLYKATSASADPGANLRYTSPGFFSDNGSAYFQLVYNAAGAWVVQYDGAYKELQVSGGASTGTWYLLQAKYNGTTLSARVNGGTRVTLAAGNMGGAGSLMKMGIGTTSNTFLGNLLDGALSKQTFSDEVEDSILAYARGYHGLALT